MDGLTPHARFVLMRQLTVAFMTMAAIPAAARAQQTRASDARSVAGSYAQPGCRLQVAPVAADTVRIQIECNRGAPTYNLGFLDERLPIRGDSVAYARTEGGGSCRIGIAFRDGRAIVTEDGRDVTCGFGAGVTVRGTYRRTSRRPPPFDLSPCG
jgi:hypothetical protein